MRSDFDLATITHPLIDKVSLDPLVHEVALHDHVFLGEATHGTAEFYTRRFEISRRLIEDYDFRFIAVEGDWPDCYKINRYVKGYPQSGENAYAVLQTFTRWPTWMWANEEIVKLIEWLRIFNNGRDESQKVGFYGLDVYSLWDSLYQVIAFVREKYPKDLDRAMQVFTCFEPYNEDVQQYAYATTFVSHSCEDAVVDLLRDIQTKQAEYNQDGQDGYFNAEQNALVLKNAEHYYRTMIRGGSDSWNIRDTHMIATFKRLVDHTKGKGIAWAHNTHVGDASYTDMKDEGMVNIGELAREELGEKNVYLVGFGTNSGSVIAGDAWDAPMKKMIVPDAKDYSWDAMLHQKFGDDVLLIFTDAAKEQFNTKIDQRAIGVVYNPRWELGNYVPSVITRRYDAYVFIDSTNALHPISTSRTHEEYPETYPTGL